MTGLTVIVLYSGVFVLSTSAFVFNDQFPRQNTMGFTGYSTKQDIMGYPFDQRSDREGVRNTCQVRGVRLTIHPPRPYARYCYPTTVLTFGCRGGCQSYSKVDQHNTTNIQRYCSCCSKTKEGVLRHPAVLECRGGTQLRFVVKFALACHCRPCSSSVHQLDIFDLRRLLEDSVMSQG